jgi:alpha-tubulin suppressor-like RCC1 family protein
MAKRPTEIFLPEKIVKLASGNDFVLFLSETGQVYSCGNGETGQLGRLSRYVSEDGRRGGIGKIEFFLISFVSIESDIFRTINYTSTYSL